MPEALKNAGPPSRLGLLIRVKARALVNRIQEAVVDAPLRVTATVLLVSVVWIGLWALFWTVFVHIRRTPLEATVAIPLVFNFFFVAMLVMLAFSNAIISYGALFGRSEAAYLLASPVTPLDVVTIKYLESLFVASWSLVLLGLPLMKAMADDTQQPLFYILFIAFFLAFIPIPGAIGLLLAWIAARWFPRRAMKAAAIVAGVGGAAGLLWTMRSLGIGESVAEVWLRRFLERMSFLETAILPNMWVASGIDHALHGRLSEALLYLCVTVSNALFLSWLVVRFVAKRLESAFDRAAAGGHGGRRDPASADGVWARVVFWYLPHRLRLIAAKDLRTFFRDPLQWSQLGILFGLMVLYLTNMPTLRLQFSGSGWFLIIPFLNLCAVSLILATFTCRFVFPLVSLEGQQLWLVGLLPLPRGRILLAKFAFAITVTLVVAVTSMIWATIMLELRPAWAAIHLAVTAAVCFGLCGFSVGIGARMPMFRQTNTARIANGLGGTTNLLASVALVAIVLFGVGYATLGGGKIREEDSPNSTVILLCAAACLFSIAAGLSALWMGARHFNRVEV
jgi:ABC-2 type transport system permease protein